MQVLEKTTTKQEFITALRSGQYEQLADGRLFDQDGRVCAMMVWHKLHGDDELNAAVDNETVFGFPNWLYDQVADRNDSGSTFNEIADYLEGISDAEFSRS